MIGNYDFKAARAINHLPAHKPHNSKTTSIRTGLIGDVAITAGLTVATKLKEGESLATGFKAAGSYMLTAEFLGGDLLCGALGATLGAAIPMPALTAGTGFISRFFSRLPVLGGAMLFARLGSTAITLAKNGEQTLGNLIESAKLFELSGQVVGATLGAAIGSFFPLPGLSQMAGALIGGLVAQHLMNKLQSHANSITESAELKKAKTQLVAANSNPTSVSTTDPKSVHEYCSLLYRAFLAAPEGAPKRLAFERYKEAAGKLNTLVASHND